MMLRIDQLRMGKIIYDVVFLDDYLLKEGKEDRRLENSPHYKLLASYERNPDVDLRRTDYFRFAKARLHHYGSWFGYSDEEGILEHMRKFLGLYERIKQEGYDYSKGRIMVYKAKDNARHRDRLGRPHPRTRTYIPEGWEIHEGHHRAAILAKLSYDRIKVDILSPWTVAKNWVQKHLIGRVNELGKAR